MKALGWILSLACFGFSSFAREGSLGARDSLQRIQASIFEDHYAQAYAALTDLLSQPELDPMVREQALNFFDQILRSHYPIPVPQSDRAGAIALELGRDWVGDTITPVAFVRKDNPSNPWEPKYLYKIYDRHIEKLSLFPQTPRMLMTTVDPTDGLYILELHHEHEKEDLRIPIILRASDHSTPKPPQFVARWQDADHVSVDLGSPQPPPNDGQKHEFEVTIVDRASQTPIWSDHFPQARKLLIPVSRRRADQLDLFVNRRALYSLGFITVDRENRQIVPLNTL